MATSSHLDNALILEKELEWFTKVLSTRMSLYFGSESNFESIYEITPPDLEQDSSPYAQFIREYQMSVAERLLLLLALIPHISPRLLDILFTKNSLLDRRYTEFGGRESWRHSGFLPTGQTALFLLAGNDLGSQFQVRFLLQEQHFFYQKNILKLVDQQPGEPYMSRLLSISPDYVGRFTFGTIEQPTFSTGFPAKRLSTPLNWEDMVLEPSIIEELGEIKTWMESIETIRNNWGVGDRGAVGYTVMFHGPSGTGKTLAATLLGKSTGSDVFRVDLSQIGSKYIGETEKNLQGIFDLATEKNWILFFDEADALFGKAVEKERASDRYANQEVAYLLQRIEDFPGVAILAAHSKVDLDKAILKHFQSLIYFPIPSAELRLQLWEKALHDQVPVSEEVALKDLAEEYQLTGGGIFNAVQHAALTAFQRGNQEIQKRDLMHGIRKEFRKGGKLI